MDNRRPALMRDWSSEDYLEEWFELQMRSLNYCLKYKRIPKFLRKKIVSSFFGKMTWFMYDQPHPLGDVDVSPTKFAVQFSSASVETVDESKVDDCFRAALKSFLGKL